MASYSDANQRAEREDLLMRIRAERSRTICDNAYITELAIKAREDYRASIPELVSATGWSTREVVDALGYLA